MEKKEVQKFIKNKMKEDKALEHRAGKVLKGIKIKSISNEVGMVRYRRDLQNLNIQPKIEYFGATQQI